MYTRENGQVWIEGPQAEKLPSEGVWIYPGEDVEWHYTCTPFGTKVTGYTIKPSLVSSNKEEDQ